MRSYGWSLAVLTSSPVLCKIAEKVAIPLMPIVGPRAETNTKLIHQRVDLDIFPLAIANRVYFLWQVTGLNSHPVKID